MKNFFLLALVAAAFVSCMDSGAAKDSEVQRERDSLQRIIDQKDNELNDIMGAVNEVQEGIRRINEAEGRVTIADGSPEGASTREVIRENMEFISNAMEQNRELINQLKEKLRTSSFNSDKLQKTIQNLQAQVDGQYQRIQELEANLAEKDAQLAAQGEQITSLNEDVTNLTAENKAKAETVATQDKELNTAWFVFGTKNELKEQKILASGDVLKSGDFNKDYFTQIDIRYDKEIKLYSKNAKVLTTHPAGSYAMEKDSNGQYEIHITNPTKFWSVSKYLVVQVK
ncbi:MAG: hypothetical protein J5661_01435 [Bacteroidaceae bacterium]|nr:hypothetical protein [Bacteroidaceae bacterium]